MTNEAAKHQTSNEAATLLDMAGPQTQICQNGPLEFDNRSNKSILEIENR
jgi:hypothetical protein